MSLSNSNLQVVLGGGRSSFLPDFQPDPEYPDRNGTRLDGKDLMEVGEITSAMTEDMTSPK